MKVFLLYFQEKRQILFVWFFKTLSSGNNVKRFICLNLIWSFHLPVSQNKIRFISVWCLRTIDKQDTPYCPGTIFIVVTTYLKNKILLLFINCTYAICFYYISSEFLEDTYILIALKWTLILKCKTIKTLGLCYLLCFMFSFLLASFF